MFLEPIRLTNVVTTLSMRWTEEGAPPAPVLLRKHLLAECYHLQATCPITICARKTFSPLSICSMVRPSRSSWSLVRCRRLLSCYLPSSHLYLTGPRGSGKSILVKRLAQHRFFTIRVNSSSESIAQSSIEGYSFLFLSILLLLTSLDSALVDSLEKAIGFWPSFSAVNKVFMWIESALPSKTSIAVSS